MSSSWNLTRRGLFKWGLISAGLPAVSKAFGSPATPQNPGFSEGGLGVTGGRAEEELFPANGLPGGGQLEIRLSATVHTGDADELEVAQRMKPFDMDSWIVEWTRVAERNEQLADKYAAEGLKVTANEYYLRASTFYRYAAWPQPESEPRMLPSSRKVRETFDKAWEVVPSTFERVRINWEGKTLNGYLRKPNGPAGKKFPTIIAFPGADSFAESTFFTGTPYLARGMAFLVIDFPGSGLALRLDNLHLPPDTDRIAKAIIDYLETRPDVDANRIGALGASMGGYSAPRAAANEKRIKAVFVWSGSYNVREDLFDYFPPIQERVRWIIGARDLADARKKSDEYTSQGIASKIECPMLVGYSRDDRIMDPQGALRLYQTAVNSRREMVEGTGHNQAANAGGPQRVQPPVLPDWAAKQLV